MTHVFMPRKPCMLLLRMCYDRLRPRIPSPRAIFPTILPSLPPRRMTHSSPYRQLRTALRHDTTSSRGRASLRLSTSVSPSTERQSRMAVSPPCSIKSSVHASSALCIALFTAERLLQSRSCATQCPGSSMTIRRVAGYWPTPGLTSRAEAPVGTPNFLHPRALGDCYCACPCMASRVHE